MCTMSKPLPPSATCARQSSSVNGSVSAASASSLARQSLHSLMNSGAKRSRGSRPMASSYQTPASELVSEDEEQQQHNVEKARRELRKLIETRIQSQQQQQNTHNDKTHQKPASVAKVAAMLERLIFISQAANGRHWVDTYADPHRLNERLVKLLSAVALRRAAQKARKDRTFMLKRAVGAEQYERILAVAEQVRQLRLNRVKLGCTKCSLVNTCYVPYDAQVNLPSVMPDPVKKLFFQTDLLHALEHAPVHALQNLDWDEMLQQAQNHIFEYREWAESQKQYTPTVAAVFDDDEDDQQLGRAIKRGRFALV